MTVPATGAAPQDGSRAQPVGDSRAPATAAATSTPPTRRWEMTAQERDMMTRFRQDYLDLLDGRVTKIGRLVALAQVEPAHVALLSLESSSAMLGLTDLADAVRRLRSALPDDADDELLRLHGDVVERAAQAQAQLEG